MNIEGTKEPTRRYNLGPDYTRHNKDEGNIQFSKPVKEKTPTKRYYEEKHFNYVNEQIMNDPKINRMKIKGSFAGLVGFVGKHKVAILKTVVAAALAFSAAAGVAKCATAKTNSFNYATQTASEIDLPNEIFNDYDLNIKNNGSATFVNSSGTEIGKYNGMDANDIAQSYTQKDGRTR